MIILLIVKTIRGFLQVMGSKIDLTDKTLTQQAVGEKRILWNNLGAERIRFA
jgi:hypothetical protein